MAGAGGRDGYVRSGPHRGRAIPAFSLGALPQRTEGIAGKLTAVARWQSPAGDSGFADESRDRVAESVQRHMAPFSTPDRNEFHGAIRDHAAPAGGECAGAIGTDQPFYPRRVGQTGRGTSG